MMTQTMPAVHDTDLLNVAQAARALGVSRGTLYNWVQRGYLKARGGSMRSRQRFTGKDILTFWRAGVPVI